MRQSIIILLGGAVASLIAMPQAAAFLATNVRRAVSEVRENDELRQTFKFTPGTRLEVSGIRGPVEIETTDTNVAEVHIVRSAESRVDLEQYKVNIENKLGRLIIRGQQRERTNGSSSGPDVRHHVIVKLPRRANVMITGIGGEVKVGDLEGQLDVSAVGGALKAGAVDGRVKVNGVSGGVTLGDIGSAEITSISGGVRIAKASGSVSVTGISGAVTLGPVGDRVEIKSVGGEITIAQAVGSVSVSGVSGALSVGITKLGARGAEINSVGGAVELRFKGELDADLITNGVTGKLSLDVPNVTIESRPNPSAIRARIGKGGPRISINGVSGNVRLALDT